MRGWQRDRLPRAPVAAAGVALLMMLGGCGQQGALFLPDEETGADGPAAERAGEERDDER